MFLIIAFPREAPAPLPAVDDAALGGWGGEWADLRVGVGEGWHVPQG